MLSLSTSHNLTFLYSVTSTEFPPGRMQFQLVTIVFKFTHVLIAASYLADHCILVSTAAGRRHCARPTSRNCWCSEQERSSAPERLHYLLLSSATVYITAELGLTSSIQTFLREDQNFLHQLDNVTPAHLRTV